MTSVIFDDRACLLGEGPLWHPLRHQLFWFDIMGKRLLSQDQSGPKIWQFDRHVSAAGWINSDQLIIASERDLFLFDLQDGSQTTLVPLEADNPITRSNDGRADPQGGIWIGTMGKRADTDAGAIYRYYRGEVRQLFDKISISNSICFSPDGAWAYFSDTAQHLVWRQPLTATDGWPNGEPQIYLDHRKTGLNPDGAVVDTDGNFWCAEWGASRVSCYDPAGQILHQIAVAASRPTCPAFGGSDLSVLYVTSARQGLAPDAETTEPDAGKTFAILTTATGQKEHQVIL
jgi:sugar lactone lactonase YvrE